MERHQRNVNVEVTLTLIMYVLDVTVTVKQCHSFTTVFYVCPDVILCAGHQRSASMKTNSMYILCVVFLLTANLRSLSVILDRSMSCRGEERTIH